MSSHITRRRALPMIAVGWTGSAARAEETRGTFGLAVKLDTDGVFSPTLRFVVVHSVQAGMPAALAGIVAGDSIIEMEGIKVAGAKAYAMADRMKRRPGEVVTLKLLRTNGESYVATLTAVAPMGLAPANAATR